MLTANDGDWTYSQDPSTSPVDEVRFLVQDTDPQLPLLSDLEVQFLIDKWAHLYQSLTYVAAVAASLIARKFAGVVSVTADGVSVNTADLSSRYIELAVQLRAEYGAEGQAEGAPDIQNLMVGDHFDPSIAPLWGEMGLHDNPAAGRQNYGGRGGAGYSPDWVASPW